MSRDVSETEKSEPKHPLRKWWRVLVLTLQRYVEIDGELRAASFAYYAFFALFPLVLLFISIGSLILRGNEQQVTATVLSFVNEYIPVSPNGQNVVVLTLQGVGKSWGTAGLVALLALTWSALRFFQALVQGVNRAWGLKGYSWWRLPLANLVMVAIMASTLLLGVVAPVVMKAVEGFWLRPGIPGIELLRFSFRMARFILPFIVLFYGLLMFYKYAPQRKTTFREVWLGALFATAALQLVAKGFVLYAGNFDRFNKLYGTLGGVVAVLMWIYLSGSMLIAGGCFCAALAEVTGESGKEKDRDGGA